jgi:hypothetical protein
MFAVETENVAVADTAGLDFVPVALAVVVNQTLKEIYLASWVIRTYCTE